MLLGGEGSWSCGDCQYVYEPMDELFVVTRCTNRNDEHWDVGTTVDGSYDTEEEAHAAIRAFVDKVRKP